MPFIRSHPTGTDNVVAVTTIPYSPLCLKPALSRAFKCTDQRTKLFSPCLIETAGVEWLYVEANWSDRLVLPHHVANFSDIPIPSVDEIIESTVSTTDIANSPGLVVSCMLKKI